MPLGPITDKDPNVKIVIKNMREGFLRVPLRRSIGCHYRGALMPEPDLYHTRTAVAGVLKRIARAVPPHCPRLWEKFVQFNARKVATLPQVDKGYNYSEEFWLEHTNYSASRRAALEAKWHRLSGFIDSMNERLKIPIDQQHRIVLNACIEKYKVAKCFIKEEWYKTWKHARGIYSREDEYKCGAGPAIRPAEKIVFSRPAFIKKIPVNERPSYVYNRLYAHGATYYQTDFESLESCYRPQVFTDIFYPLLDHLLAHAPDNLRQIVKIAHLENTLMFKDFKVTLHGKLLSGEMFTSFLNGWLNETITEFAAEESGVEAVGVFEGDDGLFRTNGPIDRTVYDRLGFRIKLEEFDRIEKASFCGLVFDTDSRIIVRNPIDCLVTLGWVGKRYTHSKQSTLKSLLRCKALSMAYEYNGCPIVTELAKYAMRVTRGIDVRKALKNMDLYQRERIAEAIEAKIQLRQPTIGSRILVEQLYGITIQQQIQIEEKLAAMNEIQELDFGLDIPQVWRETYERYVRSMHSDRTNFPIINSQFHADFVPDFTIDGRNVVV